jgi:DNA-binding protein HU-beta
MNKGELIVAVAKEIGVSKAMAERAVNAVLGNIKKGVKKGVNVIGFGSFTVGSRKARTGRNPRTGAAIKIKASRTVRFKAGKAFKKSVQ